MKNMWFEGMAWCTTAWLWTSDMIASSRGGPFSFFQQGWLLLPTGRQVFHVFFFSALSCGLANTVMCPIIPLHKQFFKSSGGCLRAVFFYISANLVPLYVNWCTCFICIAIVNMFKCFLMWELFLRNVKRAFVTEKERRYKWMGRENKKAL